jgi:hypothetical protein
MSIVFYHSITYFNWHTFSINEWFLARTDRNVLVSHLTVKNIEIINTLSCKSQSPFSLLQNKNILAFIIEQIRKLGWNKKYLENGYTSLMHRWEKRIEKYNYTGIIIWSLNQQGNFFIYFSFILWKLISFYFNHLH